MMYTCGRMHKQRKQKLSSSNASVKAVVEAVLKVMEEELGSSACDRWCSRVDAELGFACFGQSVRTFKAETSPVPRVWVPSKPKLTLALLDQIANACESCATNTPNVSIGAKGVISKILARHAVEQLREVKGIKWMEECDELTNDQINDSTKLNQALSRVAFDLLVYVHARAVDMKQEGEENAMLDLHSSDQTLVGKAMRGCGVVFCEAGRVAFVRAVKSVRDGLMPESVLH